MTPGQDIQPRNTGLPGMLLEWVMSGKPAFSRDTDLTGLWSGEYWYHGGGQPAPFSAHFIDTDGNLAGTTLERATFGGQLGEYSATISGSRGELSVRFTKIYDPAPDVHQEPIHYSGVVDAQFTLIEGEWNFGKPGYPQGRFVLVRVSRGVKAVAREMAEQLDIKR